MNSIFLRYAPVLCAATFFFLSPASQAQDLYGSTGGAGGGSADPGSLVLMDASDGTGTVLGSPLGGSGLPAIAFASDGRLFAVSGVNTPEQTGTAHLLELDPADGSLINDVGPMFDGDGNGCAFSGLSFQPGSGTLFAITANNSSVGTRCGVGSGSGGYLATIDTATGEYTIIGRDGALGNDAGGLAFTADGTLHFTPVWDNPGFLHTLDPATADILSSVALSAPTTACCMGLAWNPANGALYGSYDWNEGEMLVTIDTATGTVNNLGNTEGRVVLGIDFQPPAVDPLAVPSLSPFFLALLALMLMAVSVVALRRTS